MLRTLLIAGTLLAASGASFAHGGGDYGYGRVVAVEPNVVISFGTRYPDGFRVLVESGGARYWTHTTYYPGATLVLPPSYRVTPVHYRRDWDDRGWNGRHDERHRRHEYRHHRDD